ncbi:unnamed protein product [Menidia menidia]|uniref:(Atlantic silverside) hypothetical protein n=1 Tax=Menidia menidia TaxID=238744 RepID=A0A8S4AQU4_9TELE|nr:unnamed protein product [Menidia menidia]
MPDERITFPQKKGQVPFRPALDLADAVFLHAQRRVGLQTDGAEYAPLEAGLLFGDADVDPRVQDLVPGCHSDSGHHQLAVGVFVRRAPADAGGDHNADQLDHHFRVVGPCREALGAGLVLQPRRNKCDPTDGVAHKGQRQRAQSQSGEEYRKGQVCGFGDLHDFDEAPGPRVLPGVLAQLKAGQEGHAQSQEPDHAQGYFGPSRGHQTSVQQRFGDPQAAFGGHGASQEERAQPEKHHAASQKLTQGLLIGGVLQIAGGEVAPGPGAGRVPPHDQSSEDHVSGQVGGHQGAGEEQESGLGAFAEAVVGFDEDDEGHHVEEDAQGHVEAHGRGVPLSGGVTRRRRRVHQFGTPLHVGAVSRGAGAGGVEGRHGRHDS